jgi:hypothetical protein
VRLTDLQTRVLERLDEDPSHPAYYTLGEVAAALNWAQRLYVLITLCNETTAPFQLEPGVQWYHMQTVFPDWFMPLRIRYSNTLRFAGNVASYGYLDAPMKVTKLHPVTITDMNARSSAWLTDQNNPQFYGNLKNDLLFFDAIPVEPAPELLFTYVQLPAKMLAPTDVPDIPAPDHPALIAGALALLRLKEGGQEMQKASVLFGRFLDAAKRRAALVKARNLAEKYDNLPFELEHFDLSSVRGIHEPKVGA